MTQEEKRWLQELQRGNQKVARNFVVKYLPSLCAYFRGMGCPVQEAEDLAQETFLELWKSLSYYRADNSLKSWIFLLGRRVAWRHFRRRNSNEMPLDETDAPLEQSEHTQVAASQEEWLWLQQRDDVLRSCIEQLPSLHREVLLLHYMEDLSLQELSGVLEIAEGTVKSRLHRALSHLRVVLQREMKS